MGDMHVDFRNTSFEANERFIVLPKKNVDGFRGWNAYQEITNAIIHYGEEIGDTTGVAIVRRWLAAINDHRTKFKDGRLNEKFAEWTSLMAQHSRREEEDDDMHDLRIKLEKTPYWADRITAHIAGITSNEKNKMLEEWKELYKDDARNVAKTERMQTLEQNLINVGSGNMLNNIRRGIDAKMAKKAK
jgi:hypothetical protein